MKHLAIAAAVMAALATLPAAAEARGCPPGMIASGNYCMSPQQGQNEFNRQNNPNWGGYQQPNDGHIRLRGFNQYGEPVTRRHQRYYDDDDHYRRHHHRNQQNNQILNLFNGLLR